MPVTEISWVAVECEDVTANDLRFVKVICVFLAI